jgi:hypothetical protein
MAYTRTKQDRLDAPCEGCGAHSYSLGVCTTNSGSTVYPYFCNVCGKKLQLFEKKEVATRIGNLTRIETTNKFARSCEVCGAQGAEWHHWAPHHLFGSESDRWPKSYLCIPCHKRWHAVVTPHMSHKSKTPDSGELSRASINH